MSILSRFTKSKDTFYAGEVPENYEQRLPCVLVLDTSGSMRGKPIKELNEGVQLYFKELKNDINAAMSVETSIISFSTGTELIQDFKLTDEDIPEKLMAKGKTYLVSGVKEAIDIVEQRKAWYKKMGLTYFRPFIVLITDGGPNGPGDPDELQELIHTGVDNKQFRFWAFGVNNAHMDFLQKISHPEFPPKKLSGNTFQNFFAWLSSSMKIYSKSSAESRIDLSPEKLVGKRNDPFRVTD